MAARGAIDAASSRPRMSAYDNRPIPPANPRPTAGSHVRMTSRTKPTAKRSSRFGNDNRTDSLMLNLAFGVVILIVG